MQETSVWFLVLEDTPRSDRLPTSVFLGFPRGTDGKESTCNVGDLGLILELGRSPGGRHGNRLKYSCLENPHGQRSLAGYSPLDHKQSDTTEQLSTAQHRHLKSLKLSKVALIVSYLQTGLININWKLLRKANSPPCLKSSEL